MAWFITNMFELFGKNYKRSDSYKDINDKGLTERYVETLAESLDDLNDNYIQTLVDNVLNPDLVPDKFLKYLEFNFGINLYLGVDNRRRVIKNIAKYYAIKGTQRCYDVLLAVLGMSGTVINNGSLSVTQFDAGLQFDSGVIFDNEGSAFDLTCLECISYSIAVTGSASITDDLKRALYSIALFNEPINYVLDEITYNGVPIDAQDIYLALSSTDILSYSSTDLIIVD